MPGGGIPGGKSGGGKPKGGGIDIGGNPIPGIPGGGGPGGTGGRLPITWIKFSFVSGGLLLGNNEGVVGVPPPITSIVPDCLRPGGGPAFFVTPIPAYLEFSLTDAIGIGWSILPGVVIPELILLITPVCAFGLFPSLNFFCFSQ